MALIPILFLLSYILQANTVALAQNNPGNITHFGLFVRNLSNQEANSAYETSLHASPGDLIEVTSFVANKTNKVLQANILQLFPQVYFSYVNGSAVSETNPDIQSTIQNSKTLPFLNDGFSFTLAPNKAEVFRYHLVINNNISFYKDRLLTLNSHLYLQDRLHKQANAEIYIPQNKTSFAYKEDGSNTPPTAQDKNTKTPLHISFITIILAASLV